jgi:hypothetical protein
MQLEDPLREQKLEYFAAYRIRPLTVDQAYLALARATGHKGEEDPKDAAQEDAQAANDLPVNLLSESPLSLQRALARSNGEYVHKAVQAGVHSAVAINGERLGPEHVDWIFLTTLSRKPTPEETELMLGLMRAEKGTRGLADALWIILNSAEFNTNH